MIQKAKAVAYKTVEGEYKCSCGYYSKHETDVYTPPVSIKCPMCKSSIKKKKEKPFLAKRKAI